MIVYIIAAMLSVGFAHLIKDSEYFDIYDGRISVQYQKNLYNSIFTGLSFIPLFITAAIRWDVGSDFINVYAYGFNYIIANGDHLRWERGFTLLIRIIALFTDECQWMFAGTAFVFCFFVYRAVFNSSKNACQSILLLVLTSLYFFALNGIRQGIALAIFLYSVKFIKEKKPVKYVLMIGVAAAFHTISLIFLPLYIICNLKISPKAGLAVISVSMISAPFAGVIFKFVVSQTRYVSYFGSLYDVQDTPYVHILINTVITIIGYVYYNKNEGNSNYRIYMNIQLMAAVFTIFSGSIIIAERIILCFETVQILFVPEILHSEENLLIRTLIKAVIYSMFTFILVYGTVVLGWYDVLPYKTFLSR
ncbi:EpsG-like putative glucosyltransferase [Ruminiclostridium sufflavum DSM 19573]|uniref:EpsG-like putative glucosyltransferase n=1 Tax=Ruminiclostridium sufflavum DSM 19573 TaxID=1121337 RepID=A0A318XN95_9FIRM|nr:EpsG family protein [Ruminiclostridium sufflavum]PYG89472.1 EpsG-like putative glucosyltransferase [Ruminiclostridium sufflavum DSM 19573]